MDIFAMLRQFFLFEIIIVKHRKVVNAAERRTRDHDKWGMLPQGLEVLEDVHQPYQLLDTSKNAMNIAEEPVFCGICRF